MYQIFTDSSSDLTNEMRLKHHLEYFRMMINVSGKEYHADLDYEEYSVQELYEWIKNTENNCKTSLVSLEEYINKMKKYLDKGIDIFYIACSTALSGSFNVFKLAVNELKQEYPDRKIIGIDSCRAGMALGIMAMDLSKLQDEGKTIDDLIDYLDKNKQKYNLCGTVETLTYLKAAGRVSAASAFFGNLFSVKPIIVADIYGHNVAVKKVKGKKKSFDALFDHIKDVTDGTKNPVVYLGQGNAEEASLYLKERFEKELNATVYEYWVGPIIGISCGPGVVHVSCFGKETTLKKED
ncbi:MAG: DegV family protein [Acholeplasmatales bacterium]|nr:DegV family protein [Acholeplasmatales bacterium]